jgi:hypothetical protein
VPWVPDIVQGLLLLLFGGLSDFFVIEIVAHNGRLSKGRTVLIVIPQIQHAFPGRILPDFLVQSCPVRTALLV